MVSLKPRYKFKVIPSVNKKLCVLSNTVLGTDVLSFDAESLTYTPQSTAIRTKFTLCKWWGKDIRYWTEEILRPIIPNEWNMKEIQYHDYKLTTKSTQCTDSVTEPCVDNVFSFFAKECVWVLKTARDNPASLSSMLMSLETEDKEDFETYGDLTYVMNLDVRNVGWCYSSGSAQREWSDGGWEKWNGTTNSVQLVSVERRRKTTRSARTLAESHRENGVFMQRLHDGRTGAGPDGKHGQVRRASEVQAV